MPDRKYVSIMDLYRRGMLWLAVSSFIGVWCGFTWSNTALLSVCLGGFIASASAVLDYVWRTINEREMTPSVRYKQRFLLMMLLGTLSTIVFFYVSLSHLGELPAILMLGWVTGVSGVVFTVRIVARVVAANIKPEAGNDSSSS